MAPRAYERLVRNVQWKLIEMPLPRLQIMGASERRFIYEIGWDQRVAQDRRCFYCDTRVSDPARAHVDHFVPWSRYPDDGKEFVAPDPAAIAAALAASHGVRSSNGSSAETV